MKVPLETIKSLSETFSLTMESHQALIWALLKLCKLDEKETVNQIIIGGYIFNCLRIISQLKRLHHYLFEFKI